VIDPRLAWFAMGATFGLVLCGWPWHLRFSRYSRKLTPSRPEQPLAADLIRYSRWRSEQIERALRDQPPN